MGAFEAAGVQVTSEGGPYLGAAIGSEKSEVSYYVKDGVAKWTKELESLAMITITQLHAAFTYSLSSK